MKKIIGFMFFIAISTLILTSPSFTLIVPVPVQAETQTEVPTDDETEANTTDYVSDYGAIGNDLIDDTEANTTVYVSDYGAIGNDLIDDTQSIQNAINAAGENGYVCFNEGEIYNISATTNKQNILTVMHNNLEIDLNNSTIKLTPNAFESYKMFYICGARDVKIHNGFLQGDRVDHIYIKSISRITVKNGGTGYTAGKLVVNDEGTGGSGLAGTYHVTNGVITSINITNYGGGYLTAPVVSGIGGRGADLTAIIAKHALGYGINVFGASAEITDLEIFDMIADGIIVEEASVAGTGTVSKTGSTVEGFGTSFCKDFQKGDAIKIGNNNSPKQAQNAYIVDILDDAHLIITGDTGSPTNDGYCYFTKNVVKISNCYIHHCRRQGISVLDFDEVYIDECDINYIGTWDGINGTAPQSGIDCEPSAGTRQIRYFELTNSRINNCTGFGITGGGANCNEFTLEAVIDNLTTTTRNNIGTYFSNLSISNSNFNYSEDNEKKYNVIRCKEAKNCEITSSITNNTIYLGGTFENCTFEGSSNVYGNSTKLDGTFTLDNCDLTNIQGITTIDPNARSVALSGMFIKTGNSNPTFKNSRFNNCSLKIIETNYIIDENNVFTECRIFIDHGVTVTVTNCKFIDCDTSNNYISIINLTGCYLKGENIFGRAAKIVTNSTIILTEINNYDTFNYRANKVKSMMVDSTLKVNNELTNMEFLPKADFCMFNLNLSTATSILPAKCTDSYIVTNPPRL